MRNLKSLCQRCHLIHDRASHAAPILSEAEIAAAIARSVRQRLGLPQAEFAARYHVPDPGGAPNGCMTQNTRRAFGIKAV